jgi:DNA repair exonuclease SbcCD ATPase subunit
MSQTAAGLRSQVAATVARVNQLEQEIAQAKADIGHLEDFQSRQASVTDNICYNLASRRERLSRSSVDPARVRLFAGYADAMGQMLNRSQAYLDERQDESRAIYNARSTREDELSDCQRELTRCQGQLIELRFALRLAEAAEAAQAAGGW